LETETLLAAEVAVVLGRSEVHQMAGQVQHHPLQEHQSQGVVAVVAQGMTLVDILLEPEVLVEEEMAL
jgi:hypothetical protein